MVLLKLKTMKTLILASLITAMVATGTAAVTQDWPEEYLGLPGDNLNLYAVMKLFQESETLEGFERSLNDENSRINNLDLNGDNMVDYIRVIDYPDGNIHTIVLQAVLGRNDYQDVAVFTVERFRDGSVQIQLVGDEILYGKNYIVEPIYAETPNPGYVGRARTRNVTVVHTTYYEVAAWPVIRFIYLPDYIVWRSSWYWGYYPGYWRPWRAYYWHAYYGYHYYWFPHYYRYYHRWDHHRFTHWNDFYYSRIRIYSPVVNINIQTGKYKTTYSKPESRRDGEQLFAKQHPDEYRRAVAVSSNPGNTTRRSSAETTTSRQAGSSNSNVSRRSSESVTTRTDIRSTTGQSTGTTRRSDESVTNRSSSNQPAVQNSGTVRRSTTNTTTTSRQSVGSPSGQGSATTRRSDSGTGQRVSTETYSNQRSGTVNRSSGASTSRSGSVNQSSGVSRRAPSEISGSRQPQSTQRVGTSRSSRESSISSGSSTRRSSAETKNSSTAKKSSSEKESAGSNSSRRR